jgi:hypothetical protein
LTGPNRNLPITHPAFRGQQAALMLPIRGAV